jgi:hypothetical protein
MTFHAYNRGMDDHNIAFVDSGQRQNRAAEARRLDDHHREPRAWHLPRLLLPVRKRQVPQTLRMHFELKVQ